MAEPGDIAAQIWDMKYRLKQPDGTAVDQSVDDSWRRVAGAVAAAESDPALWTERFLGILRDHRYLPAGRILAGAGTGRDVTLFNCFVMGTVPDSMSGIFAHLREAALTLQQGGGIGYDFSTIRPKGAPVAGVGADASGPLSFMDVWDAMCRTIMSAGSRRGAMMATLRCDHPDVVEFIEAKRTPGRLRMFNLSVLATDPFMQAVADDAPWDLVFGGRVFRTLPARELWDRIMRSTYDSAEPGVIFIDRINARNNLQYCETIQSTNPCVTAESWVQTIDGPRTVGDLLGRPFVALVNGQPASSGPEGFFPTGRKPVLRLETAEGHALRLTADHPVLVATEVSRFRIETEWRKAGELQPGDRVRLHDHGDGLAWPGIGSENEGYLVGLLIGDGTLKSDKAVLSVWPGEATVNGADARPGIAGVMAAALAAARSLPHRADFAGWMRVPGRGERRLSLGAVRDLALSLGLAPGRKTITPAIEQASSAFAVGLLRGLFDADGSVQGTREKGVSIRLAQSDLGLLRAVQRMLLRLGIASSIYADRRAAGPRLLPDGKGGRRLYDCSADHELVVAGAGIACFAARIGFADTDKQARLDRALAGYRRALNRERFLATVKRLAPDGEEEVYDVRIPGPNAFDGNGLVLHNCGEQPLPPYGACLLGSVNLAKLVADPFTPEARFDHAALAEIVPVAIRLMDNVVDVSRFPLPEQAAEARAKRRIGLGVTGLADAFLMLGVRYGSPESAALTEEWLGAIKLHSYRASAEIAAEKGPFPLFDRDAFLAAPGVAELPDEIRDLIARHGIRNALLTSIAPTGTISLFAGNVASGIEPVFAWTHTRNVLLPDGSRRAETVENYAYRLFREIHGADAPLPDYFVDAQTLEPADHLVIQAAAQKHIDSSISKTINCPEDLSFDAFKDIYAQAYALGCKGCTTYRPNAITGAVLEAKPQSAPKRAADAPGLSAPAARPEVLPGETYKLRWPDSDHAIYVTLNDEVVDGRRRPFEIFINSKNMEHYAWTVALTRMISAVFRRGGDVAFVVEELKAVFDPRGGQWMGGRYVPSLLAAIGETIERHMVATGFLAKPEGIVPEVAVEVTAEAAAAPARPPGRSCPKCGHPTLIRQEGCDTCLNCGYSRCG
ncbi:MAG: ribonucleoside reductase [Inquilinus limosus]|uniref:Ribonucleoside-diphosphate reductase n=1 Tax=Inquilinus limosus TaxID=171674 RepID=A0A952FMV6_9PROT|nr:ribonucleoside reductase [Inquilinus limosus]